MADVSELDVYIQVTTAGILLYLSGEANDFLIAASLRQLQGMLCMAGRRSDALSWVALPPRVAVPPQIALPPLFQETSINLH